ncbi:chorismate mutase [Proteinivorax hydrogeniformans]|uniref:chorismate mutase n=1 Tax=Proteinivorax hydrogeniformans TaxID=1826727 RepID=A0AAU8HWS6_9FIRM
MQAIRGAITISLNSETEIKEATFQLINAIMQNNKLQESNLVSVMFSLTDDIDASNPAKHFREMGMTNTPLFCVQEAKIAGGLKKCIRVIIHINTIKKDIVHVYLRDAKKLRPDITGGENVNKT